MRGPALDPQLNKEVYKTLLIMWQCRQDREIPTPYWSGWKHHTRILLWNGILYSSVAIQKPRAPLRVKRYPFTWPHAFSITLIHSCTFYTQEKLPSLNYFHFCCSFPYFSHLPLLCQTRILRPIQLPLPSGNHLPSGHVIIFLLDPLAIRNTYLYLFTYHTSLCLYL